MVTDYAERLARHPAWVWREGMAVHHEHDSRTEVVTGVGGTKHIHTNRCGQWMRYLPSSANLRPDIHHPATKGWMLEDIRHKSGDDDVSAYRVSGLWQVSANGRAISWLHTTEGEALAAAWLAVHGEDVSDGRLLPRS